MSPHIFVTTINLSLAPKLRQDLSEKGFEITTPPYTVFNAKKTGVVCCLYQSGKLTVQGKEKDAFIEFYLEPEILKTFAFTHQDLLLDKTTRIGIDESGKGDFFGPLCVAGVYAEEKQILHLKALGVKDSKNLSDAAILKMGKEIRESCVHHLIIIGPIKYNELYPKFRNLNNLLAWGHATAIENLVNRSSCRHVIVDQFADERVVVNALKQKKLEVDLTQRHRAEEDIVVAAASILAREAFLMGLKHLAERFHIIFPKGGASPGLITAGKEFVREHGGKNLPQVAKMHFKTLDSIILKESI